MSNVLQFSLGVATGDFMSKMAFARGAVTGLVGAGAAVMGLGAGVKGVFEQISAGAKLFEESMRSGESVKNIYQLGRGFEEVGVGAESGMAMVARLQKALGGFNEMGEPTKDVFAGLGLSVEALKGMDAPKQLEAVTKAMARLNQSEGMAVGDKIFGRGGGGNAMAIGRQWNEFADAMGAASRNAEVFQRNAKVFDNLEDSFGRLKEKGKGVFAEIAAGAAPGLQDVVNIIEGMDFSSVGKGVGDAISAGVASLKAQRIDEFIGAGLEAGFEAGINYLARGLQAVCAAVPDMLKTAFEGFAFTDDKLIGTAAGVGSLMAKKLGMEGVARQLGGTAFEYLDKGDAHRREGFLSVGRAMKEAMDKDTFDILDTGARERFKKLRDDFAPPMIPSETEGTTTSQTWMKKVVGKEQKNLSLNKIEGTELEKMGFIMGGGMGNLAVDYARQTAQNTAVMIARLGEMAAQWGPQWTFQRKFKPEYNVD